MFEDRVSLPNEVKADIEQFLDKARGTTCAWAQARILPVYIRKNIKLAEAPGYGQTIFEYAPNCHGAEDYRKVAEFLHAQLQPATQVAQIAQPPIEIHSIPQTKPATNTTQLSRTPAGQDNSQLQ